MDIREVVKRAMGSMTNAELVELLDGKVDKSSVYRFLEGETTMKSDKLGHIFDALHLCVGGFDDFANAEALGMLNAGPYDRIKELEEHIKMTSEWLETEEFEGLWRVALWALKQQWIAEGQGSKLPIEEINHALLTGEASELVQGIIDARIKMFFEMLGEVPRRGRPPGVRNAATLAKEEAAPKWKPRAENDDSAELTPPPIRPVRKS
jgi:hypothetical protein